MRILKISDVYFPRINGVSTALKTIREELNHQQHQVCLLAPSYHADDAEEDGLIRIPAKQIPFDPEDRRLNFSAIMQRVDELRGRFDVVHIHTPFIAHYAGVKLAQQLQLPSVLTYHTYFEEYLHHYVPLLPRKLLALAARRFTVSQCNAVDAVVVPSTAMQAVLSGYGVTTACEIIPTGIPEYRFLGGDGARFRARHQIPADRPTLVHVGRVAHEKNIDFLLHMLQQVKAHISNVLLIIAGEGPALNKLKQLSAQLGLQQNVLFVGYLYSLDDLHDCYRAGDLFVFASRTETQGLVLLEAMALGVPVVSTAMLGTKDVLKDCAGACIAEEDVDDFSAKVIALLNQAENRQQMSQAAMLYAKAWSVPNLVGKLAELYTQVISNKNQRADCLKQTAVTTGR